MTAANPNPVRAILKQLTETYPPFKANQPLAIGIAKRLAELHPEMDAKALRVAMHLHTNGTAYLRQMEKATQRFDLEGNAAGEVTEEQRAHAAGVLKDRFKKQAEARRAAEQAKKEEARRNAKLEQLLNKFGGKSN